MEILKELYKLQNKEYASFQSKLTPNINKELFIGVRVPDCRKLAKEIYKENNYDGFINTLPHKYFDENMLHGQIISLIKDYDLCIKEINKFLPFIDNWAVCDTISPKVFSKNLNLLINDIYIWTQSNETYTIRFGIQILMTYYLNENFNKSYLELVSKIKSSEYYVNMMIAWFFATSLAKQWDSTIIYLKENKLDNWVHNKTIQKAIESYRITNEQKEILRKLKK